MGDTLRSESILDQLVEEVHELRVILNGRLGNLENSVCFLSNTCNNMASKLDKLESLLHQTHDALHSAVLPVNQSNKSSEQDPKTDRGVLVTPSAVLPLTGMDDYPQGTWLGDPDCPSQRVRSPITPQNLLRINATCVTAEKMALTLLDYLFTRDELACSNISGRSRNNKKQLDPMMVYGIRCHLQYKFNITSKEWYRICQNMDSKCRSAWKRKMKRMDQEQQGDESTVTKVMKLCTTSVRSKDSPLTDDISFDFDQLHPSNLDLSCVKVMSDNPCEMRILHPSSSNMDALPDTHEIVLADDRILTAAATVDEKSLLSGSNSNTNNSITIAQITHDGRQLHHNSSAQSASASLCSVSLASSSLSLTHEDTNEGVIVITSPDDGVVEIGVGDTLGHLSNSGASGEDDARLSRSPSPPSSSYKLLPQSSSFHQTLQLHSSSIKHQLDAQVDDDDVISYEESIHGINQSDLPHLTINGLEEIRDKEDHGGLHD